MKIISLIDSAVLAIATGCASTANLKTPPPSHIVQTLGSVKQVGIGANQTGTATLGYQAGMVDVLTVPVQIVTNTNGEQHFVSPQVVISYEIKGNASSFGSAASTLTIGIGDTGVQTWTGGQHLPINNVTNLPTPPAIVK